MNHMLVLKQLCFVACEASFSVELSLMFGFLIVAHSEHRTADYFVHIMRYFLSDLSAVHKSLLVFC